MQVLSRLTITAAIVFASLPAMAGFPAPVAVPEPVSLSLLALGAGGAIVIRSLRRRK